LLDIVLSDTDVTMTVVWASSKRLL